MDKLNKIKNYVIKNNPDIREIALNHRNSNKDLRIFKVRTGVTNG